MNINLFSLSSTASTAKTIKRYIEENSRHTVAVYTDASAIARASVVPHIRWGTTMHNVPNLEEVNSPKVIRSSQRLRFSSLMLGNDILAIKYLNDTPRDEDYPVVLRTLLNSSEGKGIIICRNHREFRENGGDGVWWSRWMNFRSEFGVHVLGGKLARKFKKLPIAKTEIEFPLKNATRGYRYSLISKNIEGINNMLSAIHKVFPLDFGRYDMGWVAEEKRWYLIEANTAPSLRNNKNTLKAYGDYFIQRFSDMEKEQ